MRTGNFSQLKHHDKGEYIFTIPEFNPDPIRPGEAPFTALNKTLEKENLPLFTKPIAFEQELQTLAHSVKAWSQLHPETKLLLVIDQFEELVPLCRREDEREKFLGGLARANKKAIGLLWDNDPRLPLVKEVFESNDNWLNSLESDFVKHSLRQKRKNLLRTFTLMTAAFLVGHYITIKGSDNFGF